MSAALARSDMATAPAPLGRSYFAKMVHANAHAVVALQSVRKLLDRSASRDALYRHIDEEIIRRCQRCGLEPDLLGDALEAAADEAAIAAGGEA